MLYTTYGDTGVEVSRLGMGCMRFEAPEKIDEMARVVQRAFDKGVTYFDTAPGYCNDQSEIICGTAFREMKKTGKTFRVATKTMAAKPSEIRAQCERSLERLHVDAIDFYHVWCLVQPDDLEKRNREGALDEFRKLKEEGLIRHIAVSTHLEHDKISDMLDEGEGVFEGMLLGLNAINCDLRYPGVREAAARGLGVVTMNTAGGGMLINHADHFSFLKREDDRTMIDAALRFNLSLPGITTALVGFRKESDVDDAIHGIDTFEPLSDEEFERLRSRMEAASENFCTQCGYCADCPAEIPVVRLMDAYNYRLLDGPEAALDHLKWHWWTPDVEKLVEACTECRACEEACTQHLPILERFQELLGDYRRLRKGREG
jgi:uncharacterized protein